jgi:shikimate 5-dehydrogenase
MEKRRLFLLGRSVSHSLSPELYKFWLALAGVDTQYSYSTISIEDLRSVTELNAEGLSITAPFKEEAFYMAKKCDYYSQLSIACNTLKKIDNFGSYAGYNTDVLAVELLLKRELCEHKRIKQILIYGNGATARSILAALYLSSQSLDTDKLEVTIFCRKVKKELYNSFSKFFSVLQITKVELLTDAKYDLVFNTIAFGKEELYLEVGLQQAIFFEYCYDLWPSQLALVVRRKSDNCCRKLITPFRLLILQGVFQFKLLTGYDLYWEHYLP